MYSYLYRSILKKSVFYVFDNLALHAFVEY